MQGLRSSQTTGVPAQWPSLLQVSWSVQALPSSHAPPAAGVNTHCPFTQESAVHGFSSLQTTGVPAHCPSVLQVSPVVHSLPSLQGAPGVGLKTHRPSTQASSVQGLWSSQRPVPLSIWSSQSSSMPLQISWPQGAT